MKRSMKSVEMGIAGNAMYPYHLMNVCLATKIIFKEMYQPE